MKTKELKQVKREARQTIKLREKANRIEQEERALWTNPKTRKKDYATVKVYK